MREANDRGFEWPVAGRLLRRDDLANHQAAVKTITMQGGVFGAVAPSRALLEALHDARSRNTDRPRSARDAGAFNGYSTHEPPPKLEASKLSRRLGL